MIDMHVERLTTTFDESILFGSTSYMLMFSKTDLPCNSAESTSVTILITLWMIRNRDEKENGSQYLLVHCCVGLFLLDFHSQFDRVRKKISTQCTSGVPPFDRLEIV